MSSGITCRDLCVLFPMENNKNRRVLDKVNARFQAGEISIVTGSVGAGKTTLLNILAGLARPTAGEVIVNDERVSRWTGPHRDRWRRQAGIVFQHDHLLHDLTVLENVMLPLIPLGRTLSTCRSQSMEALKKVGMLHHASSFANSLSGGERQKTAIARAIVNQPGFIFADEPFAHLDGESTRQMMDLLHHHACQNAVVIIAAHGLNLDTIPGNPLCCRLENGVLNPFNS
ncbi:MAG: ATP-binding cassette domain-containing protein [Desulfobacterium sp.]|nr:ATP-binding cassette domain-containing protein [Desulfobacterium sp.]